MHESYGRDLENGGAQSWSRNERSLEESD
jgi:hypothetical protein